MRCTECVCQDHRNNQHEKLHSSFSDIPSPSPTKETRVFLSGKLGRLIHCKDRETGGMEGVGRAGKKSLDELPGEGAQVRADQQVWSPQRSTEGNNQGQEESKESSGSSQWENQSVECSGRSERNWIEEQEEGDQLGQMLLCMKGIEDQHLTPGHMA